MILVRAPLRISFGGGGTDVRSYYLKHGGHFIGTAIKKYVYVAICKRGEFDNHPSEDRRIKAVFELFELSQKEYTVYSWSDLPGGTGLGSSSAFTVALIRAAIQLRTDTHSSHAEWCALMACYIEIEKLQAPIGIQDQYMSALGGLREYTTTHFGHISSKLLGLSNLAYSCLLYYTGITRSADDIRNSYKTDDNLLHAIKAFSLSITAAIKAGDFEEVGLLMHSSWVIKKQQSKLISNPTIEKMYKLARKNGAIGGKVCGAGGGGFLLLITNSTDKVRAAMKDYIEVPVQFDYEGVKVLVNE